MNDPLKEPAVAFATAVALPPPMSAASRAVGPSVSPASAPPEVQRDGSLTGVVVGRLIGLGAAGESLVHIPPLAEEPIAARATVALSRDEIGRDVVLVFEQGDLRKPIILGVLSPCRPAGPDCEHPGAQPTPPLDVSVDGERLVLTARKEIVLRCGEASITLTRAGKVLIRGAYLLSRSSGANCIKGGSVQIN